VVVISVITTFLYVTSYAAQVNAKLRSGKFQKTLVLFVLSSSRSKIQVDRKFFCVTQTREINNRNNHNSWNTLYNIVCWGYIIAESFDYLQFMDMTGNWTSVSVSVCECVCVRVWACVIIQCERECVCVRVWAWTCSNRVCKNVTVLLCWYMDVCVHVRERVC
jgi:hypothetical protein